ncbi:amidohydrolase [Salipaludibacillus sp. CF4.18]|uniref:amidohydrolase n=1 Tax=Salipaludibacillus sp. CF4.18 TaxID=3373081 RepID=UPI003EE551A3
MLLIHNVNILTMNKKEEIFNGFLTVEGNVFSEVKKGTPPQELIDQMDDVMDGNNKWLMPGLVNTHGHLGSSLLRGAGDDMPLMEWLEKVMWPNEGRFDRETVSIAAQVAMMEMIKSGTTTFLDMYHLHMDDMAELVWEKGMRAVLCRGMIGLSSEEEQKQKIQESVDLFHNYHGTGNGRVSVAMSPHAPYTCPPPFLQKVASAAVEHGMMIHTHLAETRGEVERHVKEYGKRPVAHLEELGIFNQPCLIAHGVHVNEDEIQILKKHHVAVSHNPISNLKLGSGIAPIPGMISAGLTIGIGTDSSASNNNLDMFEEMRMAALLHKGVHESPSVTNSEEILAMATHQGAKALRIKNVGKIEAGFKADFILIDAEQPHLTPANESTMQSHLVYSAKGSDVTDVFIDGIAQYSHRTLLKFDEEKILYQANHLAKNFV